MAQGKKLIQDEDEQPLSEDYVQNDEQVSLIKKVLKKIRLINEKKDNQ
jgi:HAE1 family hydrophobic/amphiphilic exporter-1